MASANVLNSATHREHAQRTRVATPCTQWSITYGGRCLNCGYDPHLYPVVEARSSK